MTPEEKFNSDVWYVLQKIKTRNLYLKTGQPLFYSVPLELLIGGKRPEHEEEAILGKLEEWHAIKIKNSEVSAGDRVFHIEILKPEFEKFYKWYEVLHSDKKDANKPTIPSAHNPTQNISDANRKKLIILDKIKNKWDLGNPQETRMHWMEYHKWCLQAGIEHNDLQAILSEFQREGIIAFQFYNPAI